MLEPNLEPPDTWEYWCYDCERPVNSDTCLTELDNGECVCLSCFETRIDRLMTRAKEMDSGYADEQDAPYDTLEEKYL